MQTLATIEAQLLLIDCTEHERIDALPYMVALIFNRHGALFGRDQQRRNNIKGRCYRCNLIRMGDRFANL